VDHPVGTDDRGRHQEQVTGGVALHLGTDLGDPAGELVTEHEVGIGVEHEQGRPAGP
jgi:hypothetical protein